MLWIMYGPLKGQYWMVNLVKNLVKKMIVNLEVQNGKDNS